MVNLKKPYLEFMGNIGNVLQKSRREGYRALTLPELVDFYFEEIEYYKGLVRGNPVSLDSRHLIKFDIPIASASIFATGKTSQGSKIAVFAHNISNWTDYEKGLAKTNISFPNYGYFPIPQEKIEELVKNDGLTDEKGNRLVWAFDYKDLARETSNLRLGEIDENSKHLIFSAIFGANKRFKNYAISIIESKKGFNNLELKKNPLRFNLGDSVASFLRFDRKSPILNGDVEINESTRIIGKLDLNIDLRDIVTDQSFNRNLFG